MQKHIKRGEAFQTCVEIVHPRLRNWMGLRDLAEAHQNVHITFAQDPVTLKKLYTISHVSLVLSFATPPDHITHVTHICSQVFEPIPFPSRLMLQT